MDKLAFVALWLLVFVVPFENALVVPGMGTLGKLVGFFALLVGVSATVAMKKEIRIHPLHWLTFLFVLLSGFSLYWSIDQDATLRRTWTYVQLLGMMWLIFQWADEEKKALQLFLAFGLGTFVLAAGVFAGMVGGQYVQGQYRFEAYNFNPNDIASILALGIPICWHASLQKKGYWTSKLFMLMPAALVIAILLTGSRAGLVKAILAAGLIFWTFSGFSMLRRLVFLAIVAMVFAIAVSVVPSRTLDRLGTTASQIESGALGGRTEIWSVGLEVFYQNPILGVGAANFSRAVEDHFIYARAPHNVFLAILVEQGLLGLGVFMLILAVVMNQVLRAPPAERMLLLTLLVVWGVTALTSNWEWRKQTWLLLALITSYADLYRSEDTANEKNRLSSSSYALQQQEDVPETCSHQ